MEVALGPLGRTVFKLGQYTVRITYSKQDSLRLSHRPPTAPTVSVISASRQFSQADPLAGNSEQPQNPFNMTTSTLPPGIVQGVDVLFYTSQTFVRVCAVSFGRWFLAS